MIGQATYTKTTKPFAHSAQRLGFWSALLMAIAAAAALGIAATTAPPRSGPNCLAAPCITAPYTDVAAFVPTDYMWMYAALLMGSLFVVLMACIHTVTTADKQLFSRIALAFATISAGALVTNYYLQLTVVQSSLLKGEAEGLSLLSQYNPHGVFIALEDIGYLMMSVSFLFIAPVFVNRTRLERSIRLLFSISGALGVGALPFLALIYRSNLEYRYEVMAILITWLTLIVAGPMLSVFFRRIQPARAGGNQ